MAASLDKKQVDELIEKYRALAETKRRRVAELEERNAHLVEAICSSLMIPASAFGMGYLRGYYGEKATILGISVDAGLGLFLHGLAACFDFSLNKGAQTAAKLVHGLANGAFACWTATMGAELGSKKRLEKPLPAPQTNTGAAEMLPTSSRALTHEDLAAIKATMPSNTERETPRPPLAPTPLPSPSPLSGQDTPVMTSATHALPPTPQKPFRFTQRWAVNPEADMRALLQSVGAPSDPNIVNHLLTHENPGDEFKVILQRARAPA